MSMKQKILKLRSEGKNYNEICCILKCSKGTVSYHCGLGQKEKKRDRDRKLRSENTLLQKVDRFKSKTVREKSDYFQRREGSKLTKRKITFNYKDVIEKFGENPKCYLTGRSIDLTNPKDYQFDHIVPATRGGDNTINNLGLASREANQAKGNMLVEEFLELCKTVLQFHGFKII